ncbi:hypothetical protein PQX77_016978 [Marasmius sp. AFHP31]|nr:hypothetical protein PQX77_016978 [Marasmius sp. AFHP31]
MGQDQGIPPEVSFGIMGAFMEDYGTLDSLYHAGISVWLVYQLSTITEVHINTMTDFIHDTNSYLLALQSGDILDTLDVSPAHQIVYSHLATKPEQYLAMGNFVQSLFHYPRPIGTDAPCSSTSVICTNCSPAILCPFSTFSNEAQSHASTSKPYLVETLTNRGGAINPFLVTSSLLPASVPAWLNTLCTLSHHDLMALLPPGHDCGYWLPPAQLFVALEQDNIKLALLYWRSLLNISSGDTKQVLATRSWKRHKLMLALLKDFLTEHSLSLKYDEFSQLAAKWKGAEISSEKLPEIRIMQDILWEVTELNF